MFKLTIKELAGKKLRLITTALAVMLGVAFMAGTLVLTDTIGKSFDGLFAEAYSGTDAYVRGERIIEGSNDTPPIDASMLDTVRSVPGVEAASGVVSGYAQLIDHDGKAIGNPGTGAPTLGDAWLDNAELNYYDLDQGRAPVADDEIVIDKLSADRRGLRPRRNRPCAHQGRVGPVRHRRHRHVRRRRLDRGSITSAVHPRPGPAADRNTRPVRRHRSRRCRRRVTGTAHGPDRRLRGRPHRCTDRHRADEGSAERHPRRHVVLQHLPADLRRHRAVRRSIHHLQHLLDHHHPASEGNGAAAGDRRQRQAGGALGHDRGDSGRWPRFRLRSRAWGSRSHAD